MSAERGAMVKPAGEMTPMGVGDEGKPTKPGLVACGTAVGTLLLVLLVIVGGANTELGAGLLQKAAAAPIPDYVRYQQMFVDREWEGAMQPDNIRQNLVDLTARPHIAGSINDKRTAEYVRDKMRGYGWEADLVEYNVLLMYPKVEAGLPYASLSARLPSGRTVTASMQETAYPEDPLSGADGGPAPWGSSSLPFPSFNGYSPSTPSNGVTGAVIYANYATRQDFEELARLGVDVRGAVVIARYGALFRGSKADNAHNAGAAALLIYSDPFDYAKEGVAPQNVFPNTRFLPETGVQVRSHSARHSGSRSAGPRPHR
jgi:N-acetylated-alpha-linked acidic dipeptidase